MLFPTKTVGAGAHDSPLHSRNGDGANGSWAPTPTVICVCKYKNTAYLFLRYTVFLNSFPLELALMQNAFSRKNSDVSELLLDLCQALRADALAVVVNDAICIGAENA